MASAAAPNPELQRVTALDVARGVCRLLYRQGFSSLCEVPLGNGRRADVIGLCDRGTITLVEIKVSLADLRGDLKWPQYLDYCDRYYWAVPDVFAHEVLDDLAFMPHRAGLIVADRFDAAVVRDAALVPLAAARRKAETLRFARRAAQRLLAISDPHLQASLSEIG
jgi:hypothetical protein